MDWILYIFKKGTRNYLVADESLESAWNQLSTRQSMSLDRCKKEYTFVAHMNANSKIFKT